MAKSDSKTGSTTKRKSAAKVPAKPPAKKPAAKKSASGPVTKAGAPKKTSHPDIATRAPVPADKGVGTTEEHLQQGLGMGLGIREIEFVEVYLTCYNGTRSYQSVYGQENYNVAAVEAHKLLHRPLVVKYLVMRMKAMFERTEEAQDALIQAYTMIAYGDVNELVEYRRQACRFCYGEKHRYQRTPGERERDFAQYGRDLKIALAERLPAFEFDEMGGVGFNPNRDPHPECPECFGEGFGAVHFHDTRKLSPAALAMYEGAEITKDGIKVKTADRNTARTALAKILKLFEDKAAEVNVNFNATELQENYETRMKRAREKHEKMMQERGQGEG